MRVGKELTGKPIYSVTDGKLMGSIKDLYLDLDLGLLNGIYLRSEGFLKKKDYVIARKNIAVLGIDAILVVNSDVVTDNVETPEVETWLRRTELQGREVKTSGGTKVGTVGDVLFDEEAQVVGLTLAKVSVEGPVAESRTIMKDALLETGGKTGDVTIDLTKAERPTRESELIEEEDVSVDEPENAHSVDEAKTED